MSFNILLEKETCQLSYELYAWSNRVLWRICLIYCIIRNRSRHGGCLYLWYLDIQLNELIWYAAVTLSLPYKNDSIFLEENLILTGLEKQRNIYSQNILTVLLAYVYSENRRTILYNVDLMKCLNMIVTR